MVPHNVPIQTRTKMKKSLKIYIIVAKCKYYLKTRPDLAKHFVSKIALSDLSSGLVYKF